jgi:cation/acetate symporter
MRFFTVPNAKEARKSVFWATTWIGYFYILIFIIGFGAITLVLTNPELADTAKGVIHGGAGTANMAAVLVAKSVGGDVFYGFISAVAFATILAVVAGLTLSGASAVSHDLYATVFKKGKADSASELKVSRITTLALGVIAVLLGIAVREAEHRLHGVAGLRHRGVGQLPGAAAVGAVEGLHHQGRGDRRLPGPDLVGGLTIVSPSVWEATLGNPKGSAWFPYTSPALFSMTIGFVGIWLFSILDKSKNAAEGTGRLPGAAGALRDRPGRQGGRGEVLDEGVRALRRHPGRVVPVGRAELQREPGVGVAGEHGLPVEAAGMADVGAVAPRRCHVCPFIHATM